MVRHDILKFLMLYLRYLGSIPTGASLFLVVGASRSLVPASGARRSHYTKYETNSDGASRHFKDCNLVFKISKPWHTLQFTK